MGPISETGQKAPLFQPWRKQYHSLPQAPLQQKVEETLASCSMSSGFLLAHGCVPHQAHQQLQNPLHVLPGYPPSFVRIHTGEHSLTL